MNQANINLAILGHKPAFEQPVPVGQLYFPSWERYEESMQGIFERQYYNNNGPLHEELERKLEDFFDVKHVICVLNATMGLMIVTDALSLTGKVLVPAFTFPASIQAIIYAGAEPVLCDVDLKSHHLCIKAVEKHLKQGSIEAIMAVNLWGDVADIDALEALSNKYNTQLYFDSAQAVGCKFNGTPVGNFGSAEVFSFHATKILNATEGGCICTNDDNLAAKLRAIRPSYYPNTEAVPIKRVANARMSEMQAAVALMSLEDFPVNRANNETLYNQYQQFIQAMDGIEIVQHKRVSDSNYQYVVCRIDEQAFGLSRDDLIEVLQAENILARRYFYPGLHQSKPYVEKFKEMSDSLTNTDILNASCIQLPLGAKVDSEKIEVICSIISCAQKNSTKITHLLAKEKS